MNMSFRIILVFVVIMIILTTLIANAVYAAKFLKFITEQLQNPQQLIK